MAWSICNKIYSQEVPSFIGGGTLTSPTLTVILLILCDHQPGCIGTLEASDIMGIGPLDALAHLQALVHYLQLNEFRRLASTWHAWLALEVLAASFWWHLPYIHQWCNLANETCVDHPRKHWLWSSMRAMPRLSSTKSIPEFSLRCVAEPDCQPEIRHSSILGGCGAVVANQTTVHWRPENAVHGLEMAPLWYFWVRI